MCLPSTSLGPDRTRPAVPDSGPRIPLLGRPSGKGARSAMTTRDVETTTGDGAVPHWEVAIIGAGPGGLGLAIQLVKSGRRRLRALRGVRRRRRHLADEHLPRRRLRRAVAPLLLFLCPEARLVQDVRQPARDPPLLRGLRRPLRHPPPPADEHPHHGGGLGCRGTALAAHRRRRGHLRGRCARLRHRDLHDAVGARPRGSGDLRRALLPLGALGARARPGGPPRGRHRDGGQRGADRPRAGQGRTVGPRLPAHAAMDPASLGQAVHGGAEAPLRPQPHRHAASPQGDLLGLREQHRVPPRRGGAQAARGDCAQPHCATGSRTTSCGPR